MCTAWNVPMTNELDDLLQISKQVLKVPLGFLLLQEERHTLRKGLLNRRNKDMRAVTCTGSPDGKGC